MVSLAELESVLRRAFRLKSPENIHEANTVLASFLNACPGQSAALDSVLQECYHDKKVVVDKPTLELFIHCLSAIKDHLQPTAISQIWWDLVLRPALRKERMSATHTRRARELVVRGLGVEPGSGPFRERLLQIYLGDLPNPISSEDAVDTVGLEDEDKEARTRWKDSLMGLLLEDGVEHPEYLFSAINAKFSNPQHRLPLSLFLSTFAGQTNFPAEAFANSPLLQTIIRSLHIDNSTVTFTVELSILTKLLPHLAINDQSKLRAILPDCLTILARVVCWRTRVPVVEQGATLEDAERRLPSLREDLDWEQLEVDSIPSLPPDPRRYFTFLYGVFPCNVIAFIRHPDRYLAAHPCESPYELPWDEFIDEDELKSRSRVLLRAHTVHPWIISQNSEEELANTSPDWPSDVPTMVATFMLLDIRNATAVWSQGSSCKREGFLENVRTAEDVWNEGGEILEEGANANAWPSELLRRKTRATISVQQFADMHLALKSGLPLEIVSSSGQGANATPRAGSPSLSLPAFDTAADTLSSQLSEGRAEGSSTPMSKVPSSGLQHAVKLKDDAIALLQRDNLLLMNELNFELFLRRQHLAQVAALHTENINSRKSEMERQRMRDALKEEQNHIAELKKEMDQLREQLAKYQTSQQGWWDQLGRTSLELKKEKRNWVKEAETLRSRDKEHESQLQSQAQLLSESQSAVFQLTNQLKLNEPKIKLLDDFKQQIETMRLAQGIWEADHKRLKVQAELIETVKSRAFNMQAIIDSQREGSKKLALENQSLQQQVLQLQSALEGRKELATVSKKAEEMLRMKIESERTLQDRVRSLEAEAEKLRRVNRELNDELLDLTGKVDEQEIAGRAAVTPSGPS